MKVLLVHNQMTPYRLPLFESLSRVVDCEVVLCYARGDDRLWKSDTAGYQFKFSILTGAEISFRGRKFYIQPSLFFRILRCPPEVVILALSYETDFTALLTYLSLKLRNVPFVLWIADTDHRFFRARGLAEASADWLHLGLQRILVREANAIVAYGQLTKRYLVETLGRAKEDVFVGSQVWPIQNDLPARDYMGNPFRYLYIGYLNERKRVADLVQVFRDIRDQNVELIIAGDGPQRGMLEGLAASDNRIRFEGYVEGERKCRLLHEAHAFVMPSGFDNMPNNILEAMAHALPIVATRECNCPEWLLENALTYAASDRTSLYLHLCDLSENRAKAERMGAASLAISGRYDIDFGVRAFLSATSRALGDDATIAREDVNSPSVV